MFILNLTLTGAAAQVALCFKDEDSAWRAARQVTEVDDLHAIVRVNDQQGQSILCRPRDLLFATVVDLDRDIARQTDMAVKQHIAQGKLEQAVMRARASPVIQPANGSMFRQ